MAVIYRLHNVYPNGASGDYRYLQSEATLAKAIEGGYLKSNYGHVEASVFSDDPEELRLFNHGKFRDLLDKHRNGFVYNVPNPTDADTILHRGYPTPEEDKTIKSWRRGRDKAAKDYRTKLTLELESCFD